MIYKKASEDDHFLRDIFTLRVPPTPCIEDLGRSLRVVLADEQKFVMVFPIKTSADIDLYVSGFIVLLLNDVGYPACTTLDLRITLCLWLFREIKLQALLCLSSMRTTILWETKRLCPLISMSYFV